MNVSLPVLIRAMSALSLAGSAVKGTRLPMLSGQRSKIGNCSDRGLNSRRPVSKPFEQTAELQSIATTGQSYIYQY